MQKLNCSIIFFLATIFIFSICQCSKKGQSKQDRLKETSVVPVTGVVVKYQLLNNEIDRIGAILANEKVDLKNLVLVVSMLLI